MSSFETLIDVLSSQVSRKPDSTAFTFLDHRQLERRDYAVTFDDLERQARSIGATLTERGLAGQPVLLLFAPGLEYISGFLGAVYAGAIPVPAYPPHPARLARTLPRLLAIVESSGAETVLTTSDIAALADGVGEAAPRLARCSWLSTDSMEDRSEDWTRPDVRGDSVCFLQYTSGSTAEPKGVIVEHRNLLANQEMIAAGMGNDSSTVGVSWLPMYHDMGLIGHIIQPLFLGIHSVLMSPLAFLQKPRRWLEAITDFGGTTSGGPNFAFDLCVRRIPEAAIEGLALDSWRLAYTGAEPVREETLRRFHSRFRPAGLRWEALFPCYGLAEATLYVSGGPHGAGPEAVALDSKALEVGRVVTVSDEAENARQLVESGDVAIPQNLTIVDPATRLPRPEGEVGEIWIQGPNVTAGYWRAPDLSRETFGAHLANGEGPYLRTGDLGYRSGSRLTVTGRLKDLIIVGGRNHYPQDIELSVERCHPSVRPGCSAAFTIDVGKDERLVVALEIERRYQNDRRDSSSRRRAERREGERRQSGPRPGHEPDVATRWDPDELGELVRQAVWREHELALHGVVLLKPGSVPRTSSGKIRRRETRAQFLSGQLEPIALKLVGARDTEREFEPPETPAEELLARIWQEVLGAERVGRSDVFVELGGDSVKAAQVVWRARESGLELSLQNMFEHPALCDLAAAASERLTPAPESGTASRPPPAIRPSPVTLEALSKPARDAYSTVVVRATKIDLGVLKDAVAKVAEHHPELRRCLLRSGESVHVSDTDVAPSVDAGSLPALAPEAEDAALRDVARTLGADLDREAGRRWAVRLLELPDSETGRRASRIVLVADRASMDQLSWQIVLDDLDRAYRALEEGRAVQLTPHTDVQLWTAWAWERAAHAPRVATDAWLGQCDYDPELFLRKARPGGEVVSHRLHVAGIRQAAEVLTKTHGLALMDLLSTAVLVASQEHLGSSKPGRIDVHGSGRECPAHDISRTVGRFEVQEPLAVDLEGAETPAGLLGLVTRHVARLREVGVPLAALRLGHSKPEVREKLARSKPAQLVLRYEGASRRGVALRRLGFALSPPRGPAKEQVELVASVVQGELEIALHHDPAVFAAEAVAGFGALCARSIRGIVSDEGNFEVAARVSQTSLDEKGLESALARALAARKRKA